ncbi:hypothetical protein KL86APRO_11754 [uncultured Alphaproteobacteria bacterium]|uniref:Uncharacterized protein n=1 Tax=uncultured Alphaproteobacteria bacterium TaxID=91750 RepID=A0A212JWB6_9PROT|nr:hypothetical protein KL86APRO_11754 [uncultured Alphaproteobacteria bacterium]
MLRADRHQGAGRRRRRPRQPRRDAGRAPRRYLPAGPAGTRRPGAGGKARRVSRCGVGRRRDRTRESVRGNLKSIRARAATNGHDGFCLPTDDKVSPFPAWVKPPGSDIVESVPDFYTSCDSGHRRAGVAAVFLSESPLFCH